MCSIVLCLFSDMSKKMSGVSTLVWQRVKTVINETLKVLNSKSVVGGIFCDLVKAFGYLNHNILLSKLQFYVVNGKAKIMV